MTAPATNTSTTDGNNTSGTTSTAGDEFKPITSQDEFNRAIADRINRERGKFADYDDLRAKAARLNEIEQANQSEIEKANNRAAAAEEKAAKVPELVADALRAHLVEIHKVPAEKAELFLTATDPTLLLRQVTALVGETKKQGNHVPREGGTNPPPAGDEMREFARNLFERAAQP